MQSLYNQVLQLNKRKGITPVETLLMDSGLLQVVKNRLTAEGYNLTKLNNKGVAILFFALVDLVFVVDNDGSFYLATLSEEKLAELYHSNHLVKRDDEVNFCFKSSQIILGNTKDVINQYLLQGKFHFVKFTMDESCKSYCFLATVGTMNPYPTCNDEKVYCLQDVSNWHNRLHNALLGGCYRLKTTTGDEICQNYLSNTRGICTSGCLLTKDLSNILVSIPLWNILDYERYAQDDLEMKLLNGVVKYDNKLLTLNRSVLENYYGHQLYTTLESIGVRRRYCLEELMSIGNKYSVAYYVNKYNLGIFDCEDLHQLELKLKELIGLEPDYDRTSISARVLYGLESIKNGHRSFYVTVSPSTVNNHKVEVVESVTSVMPKKYYYYAISKQVGYNYVKVEATSEGLALKYGQTEFKRQFGEVTSFCSLVCEGTIVRGGAVYKAGLAEQRELCQSLMYGYTENYKSYAKKIRNLCEKNDIKKVDDDYIQYLFVNQLAKKCKHTSKLNLALVSEQLIQFFNIMKDADTAEKELNKAFEEIAWAHCKHEYSRISASAPDYAGYIVDDTPEGRFIKTDYGRYKIGVNGLSQRVEVYYREKHLCNKIMK